MKWFNGPFVGFTNIFFEKFKKASLQYYYVILLTWQKF
jgi:hypothetical protein